MNAVAPILRNMTPFDEIKIEIEDLYEQVGGVTDIDTEEQHDAASGLYDELREAGRKAEELRKDEVRPLDDAKAVIQDRYHPLIGDTKKGKGKVVLGKEVLGAKLAAYRARVQAEKEAEARRIREEAEAAERSAQQAFAQSNVGDLEEREEAERLARQATDLNKKASRAAKAASTGLGLRTYHKAEITDLKTACAHYWRKSPEDFRSLIQSLADADARGGAREIPGITVVEERKAT